jgi:prepilin-type N-terminal cleavage/methylation domain-containing protein
MSSTRARTTGQRAGFTLVEVMITVAIVSILAVIAIPSFNTYIKKSRTVEATGFLAEVKARQESYRFDFGMYCNVSGTQVTTYPTGAPGRDPKRWNTADAEMANWVVLGAMPSGQESRFVYSTVAGGLGAGAGPNGAAGFSSNRGYPEPSTDFWFITSAIGDLDGDGTTMTFESYSHAKAIYSSVGDSWE